jgi:hypothetical protein
LIHYSDKIMSQRATPSQLRAVLAFEAACERLRNTLAAPPGDGKPPADSAQRREAYQLILDALQDVSDAYGIDSGSALPDGPDDAVRRAADGP